jgi:hypothetical protein
MGRAYRWSGLASVFGLVAALLAPSAHAEEASPFGAPAAPSSSAEALLSRWVVASGDNHGAPFAVVDKQAAVVTVYNEYGGLIGAAPALVGLSPGDDATPGIGDRELWSIPPEERTTPAGRFLASYGAATGGEKVLWVDFHTAISMHPVVTTKPKERRPERLKSVSPDDNRITYGCINVAADFYRDVVQPTFEHSYGVVYVLPDTKPFDEVFPSVRAWAAAAERGGGGERLAPARPRPSSSPRPATRAAHCPAVPQPLASAPPRNPGSFRR